MSAFDPSWLALREPIDHAARNPDLTTAFARAVPSRAKIVDLGCGTGANIRYLAPRLGGHQSWLGLDSDHEVLMAADEALGRWPGGTDLQIKLERRDLSDLDSALGREEGDAFTASALLDLASEGWLKKLANRIGRRRLPALFALTFDGWIDWQPDRGEEDEEIAARFAQHMRRDKGFGPALGAEASEVLAEELKRQRMKVTLEPSDWELGTREKGLLSAFLEGVIAAAAEVESDQMLEAWASARRLELDGGGLGATVGHQDLLAVPR
jgi:SAM-dependent methyltransferase